MSGRQVTLALSDGRLFGRLRTLGKCSEVVMGAVERVLKLVPDLEVRTIASSCCGMAGPFGYQAETYEVSMKMGELSLLPAVRAAQDDAILVADGASCRQQIADGAGRKAVHVARVLEMALGEKEVEGTPPVTDSEAPDITA